MSEALPLRSRRARCVRVDFELQVLQSRTYRLHMANLVVAPGGVIYLGTDGIVIEIRLAENPPTETWLVPY